MRRSVEFVSAILGLVWLLATAVLLFFVAGLSSVPWLLVAFVAMDGSFGLALALLLITNTRRPYGIDPNTPHDQRASERQTASDPFAAETADLFRDAVLLPDGRPYGRRKGADDPEVVKRLIGILEQDTPPIPAWARAKQQEAPDEIVRPSMLDLDLEAETAGLHIPDLDLADAEGTPE